MLRNEKIGINVIAKEAIQTRIFIIRGNKVMLDRDLAELYGVSTKALNQAAKRNIERFPDEFMFRLDKKETLELVTNCDRFKVLKHSTSLPYAFTEQGVAMLSSVLKSKQAIQVNIQIMKTFVSLRKIAMEYKDVLKKIEHMEQKYDYQFKRVFEAIKNMINPPIKPKKIGFLADRED